MIDSELEKTKQRRDTCARMRAEIRRMPEGPDREAALSALFITGMSEEWLRNVFKIRM